MKGGRQRERAMDLLIAGGCEGFGGMMMGWAEGGFDLIPSGRVKSHQGLWRVGRVKWARLYSLRVRGVQNWSPACARE